jgi:GAF domain-containing protein
LHAIASMEIWTDDLAGVIVEITEQDMDSPVDMAEHLADLRERGAAIAIDDVSSGYAGLLRLAQLRPDYVKIDRQVVSGVGDNVAQAAVLEALVTLSHRLGAAVIGEGVENLSDLYALSDFDVDYAQGYAVARPSGDLAAIRSSVVDACRAGRQRLLLGSFGGGRAASRTRDVYAVTAALASVGHRHDIDAVIATAALDLGVDVIGVSILASGMNLREIACTGDGLDPTVYPLTDFPATLAVFDGGGTTEVQLGDPQGDLAERALMRSLGYKSLLLVPVRDGVETIGVLEFAQRTAKRWTAQDVAHAQGLAEHLSPVLNRLGVGTAEEVDLV